MAGKAGKAGSVQSIERALDILEVLSSNSRGLGISEIGRATDLPYATIHRLTATLVARGYVRQDPETKKYVLGTRLVGLGSVAGRMLGSVAHPYLERVVELTGETANMAVLEDGYVVYVAQVPSPRMVRMFTEVGNRVLPHRTAVGKVLLAHTPRDETIRLIRRTGLPAATENTVTDFHKFLEEIDRAGEQGFALDMEEQELGVCCVAAPVVTAGGLVAAISVSGPCGRLSPDKHRDFVQHLMDIAMEMGKVLDDHEHTGN